MSFSSISAVYYPVTSEMYNTNCRGYMKHQCFNLIISLDFITGAPSRFCEMCGDGISYADLYDNQIELQNKVALN